MLLLDQDSALSSGMVNKLLAAEEELLGKGEKIAGIAPQIVDGRTGKRPCACRYRWFTAQKLFRDISTTEPVQTDAFLASGSLIRTSILQALGTMRSDLFIDHVDTEWALRGRSAGYRSYCAPNAVSLHSLGDAATKVFGRSIHLHSDIRHYYQMRNEVYLASLKTMGWQWRAYALPRIPYHFVLYSFLSRNRIRALRLLLRAIWDGIVGAWTHHTTYNIYTDKTLATGRLSLEGPMCGLWYKEHPVYGTPEGDIGSIEHRKRNVDSEAGMSSCRRPRYLIVINEIGFVYSHYWALAVAVQEAGWEVIVAPGTRPVHNAQSRPECSSFPFRLR